MTTAITPANVKIWSRLGPSAAFGAVAYDLPEQDPNVMMLTADLNTFTGLERFRKKWPENFLNIGIAEQNLLGVAAGMAGEGLNPFVTSYAAYMTARCLDQIRLCMGYMNLPIKAVGFAAGYGAGELGASHYSLDDIAMLRAIPNIVILSPADCSEIVKAVEATALLDSPVYIRLTGNAIMPVTYKEDYDFEIGKAIRLKDGDDIVIIGTGAVNAECLKAAQTIDELGGADVRRDQYAHSIAA